MAREPIGPRAREREWRVAEALGRSALDLQGLNSLLFLHDDQGHAASLVGERVQHGASWSRQSRGERRGQLWPGGGG